MLDFETIRVNCRKASVSAVLLIFAAAAPFQASAAPSTFNDTTGHWAKSYITWAVDQKLANGYSDGSFQPNKLVSEAEFLAMLLRAYGLVSDAPPGGDWSKPYYEYADEHGWPLTHNNAGGAFRRGQAAQLLATAANGKAFTEQGAIQWLLDENISSGRTSATVSGFVPDGKLTRAEALTFFYNLKEHTTSLSAAKIASKETTLGGIALNDSLQELTQLLGKPLRIDQSEYGFSWYVYNGSYSNYMMFGVIDNQVTALFSNSGGSWRSGTGIEIGQSLAEAKKLTNSFADREEEDDYYAYTSANERVTLFIDRHDNDKIIGMIRMNQSSTATSQPAYSNTLQSGFELQMFDLVNAERAARGISALQWDKLAAAAARKHSNDMKLRDFFDHNNPDGISPFDRMSQEGVIYTTAAENIAAGYLNSIYAHYGWMNSTTGHRESLLNGKLKRLGTGIAFGGSYQIYYTQNFYTP
ncbi:CAP-associated domain-containing protein [Paenibacillus harenae]|uniref:CAP-associated domain-containing protein n=1 Tax=Paenibacillus harenae TaxID=306543 RepID=UPI000411090D|nr:CAP-associated domain-containing protein [Paenibacillus harenae]